MDVLIANLIFWPCWICLSLLPQTIMQQFVIDQGWIESIKRP